MLEKNHNHTELPHHDHMAELEEKDFQNAVTFYAGEDTLQEMPVATSADLRHGWGPVDPEDLDALNIVALETNDKAALEALEEKQEKQRKKEAAKKNLPSKNTSANLAKIQSGFRKPRTPIPLASQLNIVRVPLILPLHHHPLQINYKVAILTLRKLQETVSLKYVNHHLLN